MMGKSQSGKLLGIYFLSIHALTPNTMAKKLFAMAIMMIAAISFTSCEKDDIVDIYGNGSANINGGDEPDPEVEYVLRNIHKNNTVDNSTEYPEIIDNHNAQLVNRQTEEVVAEEGYDNVFKAEYDRTVYVPYGELNSLVGKRFEIDADGIAHIGSTSVKFTLVRQGETPSVYFDENGKTYSYPEDLECCKYTFLNVQTAKQFAADNILPAEIVVLAEHYENGDTEELTLLGEFTAVEGDHFDREFDEYVTVTGNGTATLKEYETQNGERTGKETLLKGTFEYTFNAGAEIVKTSANQPSLQGNVLNVNANSTSFSYTLDGAVFNDNWTTIVPTEVEFTATDGTKIRRPFKSGWTLTSLSFTNVNNVWSNNAQLAADGIAQDDDTQIIRLNAVIDWEPADNATVTGKNETSLVVYETENGIRTGKTEIVKADYTAILKAGDLIRKKSQDILRLSGTKAILSGTSAAFTYILDNENFQDQWMWNAQSTATFTLPNGKTVTKSIKAEYTVRSTDLTSNDNIYSNTASLYADNIVVASDVQKVKVARATINGYTALAIHVTTAYHAANEELVSDGTKYEEVFRSDNDHSQFIVRDVTFDGSVIKQYNLTNVDESAIISLLTTAEGFKPAYLEREFGSDKKRPQSWGYEEINGNGIFGVNSFMALTVYNTDPWIASVYATEDGVAYGNIHIY